MCRRGYFVEGMGGAQFALPGAVERLRAGAAGERSRALVIAAADPAQPYGAALPWPRREGRERRPARRPARVGRAPMSVTSRSAGAVRRSAAGAASLTLGEARIRCARRCVALAEAVRAGRVRARAGADRRRAGDRLGSRWGADRARLPLGPAPADTDRLSGGAPARARPRLVTRHRCASDRVHSACTPMHAPASRVGHKGAALHRARQHARELRRGARRAAWT